MNSDITHLGKYEIKRLLGKGAMGVVYEGFDTGIERRVAIKAIHKNLLDGDEGLELRQRFKREAQAAGKLMHQNIVAIYEYGEDQGVPFIAMEFIQGKELAYHIQQQVRFDIPKIIDIMTQTLDALRYVHNNGVIHRDIKPANIIILDNGQIKVADFGIARIDSSTMTHIGAVMGTPSYMSPEQFMGQRVDNRTDLFAMGVILYELLTGEKPFPGSGMATIMQKVLYSSVDDPSFLNYNIPKAFDPLIQKALAKRSDDRFQNAQEFLMALRLIASENKFLFQDEETRRLYATQSVNPVTPVQKTQTLADTVIDFPTKPAISPMPPTPTITPKKRSNIFIGVLIGLVIVLGGVAFWFIKSSSISELSGPLDSSNQGTVSVVSDPANAVILVNDKFMGISPNQFPIKTGDHQLILRKEGYYELAADISVETDKTLEINVSLDPMVTEQKP